MTATLSGVDADRLERSCRDSIRFGAGARGLERAAVRLSACRFEPHRHDTYAIGVTTYGVQTFRYRGSRRTCLPGQLHVLHPDELPDGAAATDEGLGYRILYLAPELVREAVGYLPFVADPVQEPSAPVIAALAELDEPVDGLALVALVTAIADVLREREGGKGHVAPIDLRAVELVREHLDAHAVERTAAATLESIAGIDRFAIARQFRRAFGTSPDRYRTLRRLAL